MDPLFFAEEGGAVGTIKGEEDEDGWESRCTTQG
jgi:hypothetical protein